MRISDMADRTILRNELTTDPLVRGYSGMTDQQATDDLNTQYRPAIDSLVSSLLATEQLFASTKWHEFRERALARVETQVVVGDETTITVAYSNPNMRTFVDSVLTLSGPDIEWDLSDAGFWGTLTQACVTETSMGAAVRTAFLGLRDNRITRGVEIGVGEVLIGHVIDARAA